MQPLSTSACFHLAAPSAQHTMIRLSTTWERVQDSPTLSTECHVSHCLQHDPFQVKGAGKNKHPLSKENKKTYNTPIPTTGSDRAHKNLKQ